MLELDRTCQHEPLRMLFWIIDYLAYKFDMEAIHNSSDDVKTYLGKRAYQLIHNNVLGQGMAMRNEDKW